MFHLQKIDISFKEKLIEYLNEHSENELINGLIGGGGITIVGLEEWISKLPNWEKGIDLHTNFVPSTMLMFMKDSEVIGLVNIRHELNDYLAKYGGHIGYGFRPTARGKGYSKEMINLTLKYCIDVLKLEKVLITCKSNNTPSKKTIEYFSNYKKTEIMNGEELFYQYWLDLSEL